MALLLLAALACSMLAGCDNGKYTVTAQIVRIDEEAESTIVRAEDGSLREFPLIFVGAAEGDWMWITAEALGEPGWDDDRIARIWIRHELEES